MKLDIRQLAIEQEELRKKVEAWTKQVNLDEKLAACQKVSDVFDLKRELIGPLFDDEGQVIETPSPLQVTFAIAATALMDKKNDSEA